MNEFLVIRNTFIQIEYIPSFNFDGASLTRIFLLVSVFEIESELHNGMQIYRIHIL